jgi:hypothetical protein
MRRTHDRFLVPATAVLATALIAIAASACAGGSGGDRGPAGPRLPTSARVDHPTLTRALEATRAVESGRVEVATAVTDLSGGRDPTPDGLIIAVYRVVFDRRLARVEVDADLSGAAAGSTQAGEAAAGGGARVAARMIAAGDMVYARDGSIAAIGPAAGDWVAIDRDTFVDRRPTSDAATLLLDPLGPFGVVADVTGDGRVVGHDVIRGSPVTHVTTGAGTGAGAAPVDVWIDDDGLIRRLEIRLPGSAEAGVGRVVTTVELFDIGRAVTITPPVGER